MSKDTIFEEKGNGRPFNPWGGITIHGVYYFLAAGALGTQHTLYRHQKGDSISEPVKVYSTDGWGTPDNSREMLVLLDILEDRKLIHKERGI